MSLGRYERITGELNATNAAFVEAYKEYLKLFYTPQRIIKQKVARITRMLLWAQGNGHVDLTTREKMEAAADAYLSSRSELKKQTIIAYKSTLNLFMDRCQFDS